MIIKKWLPRLLLILLFSRGSQLRSQSLSPSGNFYAKIYFNRCPSPSDLKEIREKGIIISELLGNRVYLSAHKSAETFRSTVVGVDSIIPLQRAIYIHPELFSSARPTSFQVALRFAKAEQPEAVLEYYKRKYSDAHFIHGKYLIQFQADSQAICELSNNPWVVSVEPALGSPKPLDRPGTTLHRTLYIGNDFSGLPHLRGKGMVAGIGDGGFVAAHKDFDNRLFNTNLSVIPGFGNHGDHNSGLMMGAGKISTSGEGMAPQAFLYTAQVYDILDSTPSFYNNFGLIATNNSYGYTSSSCSAYGIYNAYSAYVDAQLHEYPKVLHYFAAGNGGSNTCAPYPNGFGTLESFFNIAKNAVMVGNVDQTDYIHFSSSKGPAADGRIKPDLVGYGTNVFSTVPNNGYAGKTGTSHSTPGVMGAGILLAERYKQLHQDSLPDGELMKSIMMLSADDLGHEGPDFTYGYGRVNARKALDVLESGQYIYGQVNQNDSLIYHVAVPAGCSQFRVMLGWRDVEGNTITSQALVNNLDLKLTHPSGAYSLPWVLDTARSNVDDPATRGMDDINNHELITLNLPDSGNYRISILGKDIPSGPQDFYITYQFVKSNLTLTYPVGKEKLISGLTETIRWDADGISTGTYSLSYSVDSGATWDTLNNALPATARHFFWTVPTLISGTCLVRIIHSSGLYDDTSIAFFTISPKPTVTVSACDRQVRLSWAAISGASFYEVCILDSNYNWRVLGQTTGTAYTIPYLKNGVTYFFSVRTRLNNITGDLGNAVSGTPSAVLCGLTYDATVYELISPMTNGRVNTGTALSASQQIRVTLKNLGSAVITGGIPVSYSVNGSTPETQTTAGNLNSNASTTLTFNTTSDLSQVGSYNIKIWTGLASDQNRQNDTVTFYIQQWPNDTLAMPYVESFENVNDLVLNYNNTGIPGADRFDYINSGATGRLRTAAGPGYYSHGSRAFSLDRNTNSATTVKNFLTLTLNLSHRDTGQGVHLYYDIKQHGEEQHAIDSLWIRGNDAAAWIKIRSTCAGLTAGIYHTIGPIRLDSILMVHGQNFSSSTQIRFGQEDDSASRMSHIQDGITLDHIVVSDVATDISLDAGISPATDCRLSDSQSVQIRVSNPGASGMLNVPVYYSVNGGGVISGTIPYIAPSDSIIYTFPTTFNAAAVGLYSIKIWSGAKSDQNRLNDTITLWCRHLGWVNTFPYIEDFETNPGNFYISQGSIWQWGSPSKTIIDTAANGSKCWVTNLSGNYPDGSMSVLNSGCFDFSALTVDPILSFNRRNLMEQGYDFAYMEFSEDDTLWNRLGAHGQGTGWYQTGANQWTGNDTFWQVSSVSFPLAAITNRNKVRFRWVFTSDSVNNSEGMAIDDINIYHSPNHIYTGTGQVTAVSSGNGWVDFQLGGHLLASVKDHGQILGNIQCSVYKKADSLRYKNGQPYLNRSWVIQPATPPAAPCLVRLYITKAELDSLIAEDSVAFSFQEFGVTKWSGAAEDSSWDNNNTPGVFILPANVAFKPFNDGYFAEFQVSNFSEFYINSGGPGRNTPLPLRLLNLSGEVQQNDAALQWSYLNDEPRPDGALEWMQPNQEFVSLYTFEPVVSPVMQTGNYIHSNIFGQMNVSAYRLRLGQQYSEVITLRSSGETNNMKIYPNPASEVVKIISSGTSIPKYEIFDLTGKEVMQGVGTQITVQALPEGIYVLKCETAGVRPLYIRLLVERSL